MRVNINVLPRQDVQYDLWAPLSLGFKPNPNTHIKGTSQEILEVFKNISIRTIRNLQQRRTSCLGRTSSWYITTTRI